MRIFLALSSVLALLAFAGCDSPDISDYALVSVTDASTSDGAVSSEDASTPPDADLPSDAQLFCERYNQLCPFGDKVNWFADEASCLSAYEAFTADQITCVGGQLDEREAGGGNNTCSRATGSGQPCG